MEEWQEAGAHDERGSGICGIDGCPFLYGTLAEEVLLQLLRGVDLSRSLARRDAGVVDEDVEMRFTI